MAERVALGGGDDIGAQVAVGDPAARLLDRAQVGHHVLEGAGGGAQLAADADVDVLVEVTAAIPRAAASSERAAR